MSPIAEYIQEHPTPYNHILLSRTASTCVESVSSMVTVYAVLTGGEPHIRKLTLQFCLRLVMIAWPIPCRQQWE